MTAGDQLEQNLPPVGDRRDDADRGVPEPGRQPMTDAAPPLLGSKAYDEPSVFLPENLLRECRRQRGRPDLPVPSVCLLDPDGDIVLEVVRSGRAKEHPGWACYHTTLWTFDLDGVEVGVVGSAVGASFAVLVAEQLAASGCELLISLTSSGSITASASAPCFVLIERALRDDGTSLHYLPPSTWAVGPAKLLHRLDGALSGLSQPVITAATWTTDAPYRETPTAIRRAVELGVAAVEMEAAALYAYATARERAVVCVAHVTNALATDGDDFEKGEADGAHDALEIISAIVKALEDTDRS